MRTHVRNVTRSSVVNEDISFTIAMGIKYNILKNDYNNTVFAKSLAKKTNLL